MSYQLVISLKNFASFLFDKHYGLVWEVVISRRFFCLFVCFFELETMRNVEILTITLTIHTLCHFRPVLPVH